MPFQLKSHPDPTKYPEEFAMSRRLKLLPVAAIVCLATRFAVAQPPEDGPEGRPRPAARAKQCSSWTRFPARKMM